MHEANLTAGSRRRSTVTGSIATLAGALALAMTVQCVAALAQDTIASPTPAPQASAPATILSSPVPQPGASQAIAPQPAMPVAPSTLAPTTAPLPVTTPMASSVPAPGAGLVAAPTSTPPTPAALAPTAVPAPAVTGVAALIPHDLSPWSMFMNADIVVKVVMVGLFLASLLTWTIFLAKGLELFGAKRRTRADIRMLVRAPSLEVAASDILNRRGGRGAVGRLVEAAVREVRRSADLSSDGIKERLAIALSRQEARSGRMIALGTGLLATIGSTSPFIGLFGTVWGIMNSFIGISQSHTTNLAVVAPGIAEALLATACGLVAAIPAVIIYNVFARSIAGYRALLSDASGEILQHLSRDLERQSIEAEARMERASMLQQAGAPPVRLRSGA